MSGQYKQACIAGICPRSFLADELGDDSVRLTRKMKGIKVMARTTHPEVPDKTGVMLHGENAAGHGTCAIQGKHVLAGEIRRVDDR